MHLTTSISKRNPFVVRTLYLKHKIFFCCLRPFYGMQNCLNIVIIPTFCSSQNTFSYKHSTQWCPGFKYVFYMQIQCCIYVLLHSYNTTWGNFWNLLTLSGYATPSTPFYSILPPFQIENCANLQNISENNKCQHYCMKMSLKKWLHLKIRTPATHLYKLHV